MSKALGQPGAAAADAIAQLIADLGLPATLRGVGLGPERFDEIAEKSMLDRWVHTNPRPITGPADIHQILSMAA